jgi:hypothetical protein
LGQEPVGPGVRLLEFLVLHLQLDLVDQQFVDEARFRLRIVDCGWRSLLTRLQPFLGEAPQFGGGLRSDGGVSLGYLIRRVLFHGLIFFCATGGK